MHELNLPLHPSKRHPLTGEPLRAVWVRPDGRVMWPMMGGDDTVDAAAKAAADTAAAATKAAADKAAADAAAAADKGGGDGFPKDTPVAEMKPTEQAAYWRHQARKHEDRNKEWQTAAGGKTPAEIKAEVEAAEKLRRDAMTEADRKVAEARDAGKQEAASEYGPKAAKAVFELALSHVEDPAEKAEILETIDIKSVIKDDGSIDTDKVARIVNRLAPAGKDGEKRIREWGGGDRRTDKTSGVAAGRQLFADRRKKPTSSTST